jgi:L-arabinose isomerase
MQIEASKQKIHLSDLADEINDAARQCNSATASTIASGMLTVQAAIRAGHHLNRAKKNLGHCKFISWLAQSCPEVNERTAQRWMKLSKATRVSDLSKVKSIAEAFRIIQDVQGDKDSKELQAIGTAAIDHYVELTTRLVRRSKSFIDVTAEVADEIDRMPEDRRNEVRSALQPLVDLGAKLGVTPKLEAA